MAKITPKNILIPTAVLTVICLVISAALALTNHITKDRIAEINRQNQIDAMNEIFSNAQFEKGEIDSNEYYSVKKEGKLIGYIFTTSSKGYGGDVQVMTGLNANGSVKTVRVISCPDETPGLGQKAKDNPEFLSQYEGKNSQIDTAKNAEIDAISGATVTTTAVTRNVNEAIRLYEKIKGGDK